ncbi:hypothetical protein B296_00049853 [Ensete ventricosum]|uniref:Uncharacterized protein n=1 Tax=Ensete ventricosum TaxID=4639 RepID=A0A426XFC5_ENSVE|nr:hypothetical protein B296_00049853 [Ensete ventricosum]
MMRLNRVELFYAFLLHFRNEHSEDGGSRPPIGVADHGQALCRGGQLRPRLLQWWPPVAEPGDTRPRLACKESMSIEASPTCIGSARPQGRRLQALRPSAHWSTGDYRRGDRQQRTVLSPVQGRRRQQRSEGKG